MDILCECAYILVVEQTRALQGGRCNDGQDEEEGGGGSEPEPTVAAVESEAPKVLRRQGELQWLVLTIVLFGTRQSCGGHWILRILGGIPGRFWGILWSSPPVFYKTSSSSSHIFQDSHDPPSTPALFHIQ